jgi:hypothetical protein
VDGILIVVDARTGISANRALGRIFLIANKASRGIGQQAKRDAVLRWVSFAVIGGYSNDRSKRTLSAACVTEASDEPRLGRWDAIGAWVTGRGTNLVLRSSNFVDRDKERYIVMNRLGRIICLRSIWLG